MDLVIPLYGVPVYINVSVVLLLVILWIFSIEYIKKHYPGKEKKHYRAVAVLALLAGLASLILHELAHAFMARQFGIPVISAGIHGLGAYVRIDTTDRYEALAEILLVAAGPVTNLIIGALLAVYVKWAGESLMENTVQSVAYLNIYLGLLNFLPVIGLDGSKVLHGLVWGFVNKDVADIAIIAASIATLTWYFAFRKKPVGGEGFIYKFFKTL